MSVVVTNSVKPSYNDVAHLTLIVWAYSLVLLHESQSRIWLCMSWVLSAKLTDKHLSNETLIYSWSTNCIYALFAFDPRQCCFLPIIPFWSPGTGTSESAHPMNQEPELPWNVLTLQYLIPIRITWLLWLSLLTFTQTRSFLSYITTIKWQCPSCMSLCTLHSIGKLLFHSNNTLLTEKLLFIHQ
jgi:hypothetical protein